MAWQYGLRKINMLIKNMLEVIEEILLKANEFRSIWDFVKTVEFTEMSGTGKESQKHEMSE